MESYKWLLCICSCVNLCSFSSGFVMNITSNVTEVSLGYSYSVTCRTYYQRVDFYRNNTKRVRISRGPTGATCTVNNADGFKCTITYNENNRTYDHQLIVLYAEDTGTVQWQCKHQRDNNTVSNTVAITAKESVSGRQIPPPLNTTIIVTLGAVCAILLIIIVTFITIFKKLHKKQPVPADDLQISAEGCYDDLGNTNTDNVDYQQLHIYENIQP